MATKKTTTAKAVKRTSRAAKAKTAPSKTSAPSSGTKTVRRTSAAKLTKRNDDAKASIDQQIAVAAYYRAERRGFAPGGELDDWLGAELLVKSP